MPMSSRGINMVGPVVKVEDVDTNRKKILWNYMVTHLKKKTCYGYIFEPGGSSTNILTNIVF